jgi:hypothetical protein
MKEKTKAILVAVFTILAIGTAIMLIENPKPTKLGSTISREIEKVIQ